MKTSDDLVTPRSTTVEIPDYESDPARIVERVEDELVFAYHFNLQGKPDMTDSIKTALQAAGVVHTRHNYFDLVEFLNDKLDHEQLRSQVTNSMAWFVDTLAINGARALFYRDWTDAKAAGSVGDADEYNAFIDNFLSSVDLAKRADVEIVDGLSRDLVQLIGFSPKMHDIASAAASAAGRDYLPRTFDELLLNEKPMAVTALTQEKLAQIAKYVEEDDAKAEADVLKQLINKTQLNAKDAHAARQKLNPIVLGLIGVAERQATEVNFWDLDKKLQIRMVTQAINGLKGAAQRLATYNSIDVFSFAQILKNVRTAEAELRAVLETMADPEETAVVRSQQRAALKARAKDDDQAKEDLAAVEGRDTTASLGSKPDVGLPQNANSYPA